MRWVLLLVLAGTVAAADPVRVFCYFGYQVLDEHRAEAARLVEVLQADLTAAGWQLAAEDGDGPVVVVTVVIGRRHNASGALVLRHAVMLEHSREPRLWVEQATELPAPYASDNAESVVRRQLATLLAQQGLQP
ncbi:MAG: hypothetical protein PF961_21490 [Planctomycetota bacterium]|jgi:hypothetical protein|nr:hypothetical protein [Planctomycetota bacterium]